MRVLELAYNYICSDIFFARDASHLPYMNGIYTCVLFKNYTQLRYKFQRKSSMLVVLLPCIYIFIMNEKLIRKTYDFIPITYSSEMTTKNKDTKTQISREKCYVMSFFEIYMNMYTQ